MQAQVFEPISGCLVASFNLPTVLFNPDHLRNLLFPIQACEEEARTHRLQPDEGFSETQAHVSHSNLWLTLPNLPALSSYYAPKSGPL